MKRPIIPDCVEWVRRNDRVHSLLCSLGFRRAYRAGRQAFMRLRYGRSKRLTIAGFEVAYATNDEASWKFFNDPYWFGELFEKDVVLHMAKRLQAARCFVDVGANQGFYTIIAAKILSARGGVVHAIEMDADNVEKIRENVALNALDNVVIHHVALGDRTGVVEYYRCGSEVNTLEVGDGLREKYSKASVPITTLDELVSAHKIRPDIVKIDVEGAEYDVLRGMPRLLGNLGIDIYCELHLHQGRGSLASFGHTANEVFEVFSLNGFSVERLRLRKDSVGGESAAGESPMLFLTKN